MTINECEITHRDGSTETISKSEMWARAKNNETFSVSRFAIEFALPTEHEMNLRADADEFEESERLLR